MAHSTSYPEQHPFGLSVFLHLFPGVLLLLGFVLIAPVMARLGLPTLLAIIIVDALVVLPLMMGILYFVSRKKTGVPVLGYRERFKWPQLAGLATVSLLCAVMAFLLMTPFSDFLSVTYFYWLPEWFAISHYATHPESYAYGAVLVTWLLAMVVTSIAAPIVEELYFRGYLLPRIDRFGAWAPLINLVLFALYHFWTIWLTPVRIVALLPMVYLVWFKRCLYIGVIVHLALNLVGDTLLTAPILVR
ncbi:MAG: CPBP family intramembrane metalloprotease [Saccharospirillum sp.]|nr:CPBP family intramembrane metalloprotease [Saccharospirillum sp.]